MKTVLIVDDDPVVRDMIALILEDGGFHPVTARHGQEALECLHQQPPHLVISDLAMPVLDGWGLYAAMQANPHYQHIPFVVMSSVLSAARIRETMPAAVVPKPIHPARLLETIKQVLDDQHHNNSGEP